MLRIPRVSMCFLSALSALGFGGLLMGASGGFVIFLYSSVRVGSVDCGGCVPLRFCEGDSALWKTRLSIWLFSTTGNSSMASGRSIACLLRSWALRCLCRFILKDCAGAAPCRLVSCFCQARLPRLSRTRLRACSSTRLERDPSHCFSGRALLWVRALWSHAAPRRLCGPCAPCKACVRRAFRGLLARLSRGAYRGSAVARFPTARVLARPHVKHAPRLAAPHGVLRLRRRIGGRGGLPCRIRAFRCFLPCLLRDYRPARKISERALQ